jgi:nicotinate phosphoribosyltransferase
VRLDSGDLVALSREVRKILDDAGLTHTRIIASGGLDEFELERFSREGAPIDAYGVGTQIGTSADVPILDMAYKLVEYEGTGRLKLSTGKMSLVGAKQVWRTHDADGTILRDVISARGEAPPGGEWAPLLEPVMNNGAIVRQPSVAEIKERFQDQLSRLPGRLRVIDGRSGYDVRLSDELQRRQDRAVQEVTEREGIGDE